MDLKELKKISHILREEADAIDHFVDCVRAEVAKTDSAYLNEIEKLKVELEQSKKDQEELIAYNKVIREELKEAEKAKNEAYEKLSDSEAKLREMRKYRSEEKKSVHEPKKGFRIREE